MLTEKKDWAELLREISVFVILVERVYVSQNCLRPESRRSDSCWIHVSQRKLSKSLLSLFHKALLINEKHE